MLTLDFLVVFNLKKFWQYFCIFIKLDPNKVYSVQDVVKDEKGGWTIVVDQFPVKPETYHGQKRVIIQEHLKLRSLMA